MSTALIFALVCAVAALVYGGWSISWIMAKPTGNERMREIAAAIQAEFVGAGGIHCRLRLGDESFKLVAKHRQIGLPDYPLEDEVTLFLKLLLLLGGDRECQRFLLIWNG